MEHVILLVDDLKSNVLLLEGMLSGLGYRFIRATSGSEALTLLESHTVSLALLDVQMPGMDGYTLARHIRSHPKTSDLPIIFVTAAALDEQAVAGGYDAGAVDFLLKPVNEHALRRKAQILCSLVEKERRLQKEFVEAGRRNEELEDLVARLRALEEAHMESELRYRSLISLAPLPILVQVHEKIVYFNAAAMQVLGLDSDSGLAAKPFHVFVSEADREEVRESIAAIVQRGGRSEPICCQLLTGAHVEINMGAILYDDDVGVQMAIQDVTQHKELADQLRRLSQMDGLTGVANRRTFNEALDAAWNRATRSGQPLSLLMLDLDQFKAFNDRYGHLAGDECLKKAAAVLSGAAIRPDDLVARYGGEEFAVILPDTAPEGASHVAAGIVERMRALNILHEGNRNIDFASFSCGVATKCPEYGNRNAQELIRLADQALYQQKKVGGNGFTCAGSMESPGSIAGKHA